MTDFDKTLHAQLRHLIDDLTVAVDDDGRTRYAPKNTLMFSNFIGALIELMPTLAARAQPAQAVPPECDVRKIMLDVVPGIDGEGHEVYAKNVADVVKLLTEMGQRIEDLEGAQQAEAVPKDHPLYVFATEVIHGAYRYTELPAKAKAAIAAQGEKP